MGFIKENYNNNKVGLVVSFLGSKNTPNYIDTDSIQEAMDYFNLQLKNGFLYYVPPSETALENLEISPEDASSMRAEINSIVEQMNDTEIINHTVLCPVWKENQTYSAGTRVRFNGNLYKAIQTHTSKAESTPDKMTDSFLLISKDGKDVIPKWASSVKSSIGDIVKFKDSIWESLIDNNSWSPEEYPSGWLKI